MSKIPRDLQKVKLIGDGKFKPFWAPLDEVNGAYCICRDFMAKYIFPVDRSITHRTILDLIDHGVGAKGYEWKCGHDGSVVKKVYDNTEKKCWQRSRIRRYNVYNDKYRERGYYIIPHIKLESCKIKDKSGIHYKERMEIARILMDKIIAPYFANTFLYTEEAHDFSLTIAMKSGESIALMDLKSILMILFEISLLYDDYVERMTNVYNKAYDHVIAPILKPLTRFGLFTGAYMHGAWINTFVSSQHPIGYYNFSGISKDDFDFHLKDVDSKELTKVEFGNNKELHLFEAISNFTEQMLKDDHPPRSFHFAFEIDEKFWPAEYIESLERKEAV